MVAASVKPYRLQRKTTLFKGGFLLCLIVTNFLMLFFFLIPSILIALAGMVYVVKISQTVF